jgi:hypothetical protein
MRPLTTAVRNFCSPRSGRRSLATALGDASTPRTRVSSRALESPADSARSIGLGGIPRLRLVVRRACGPCERQSLAARLRRRGRRVPDRVRARPRPSASTRPRGSGPRRDRGGPPPRCNVALAARPDSRRCGRCGRGGGAAIAATGALWTLVLQQRTTVSMPQTQGGMASGTATAACEQPPQCVDRRPVHRAEVCLRPAHEEAERF